MSIPILVFMYVLLLATTTLREQIVLGKKASLTWEELLASLRPVRTAGLVKISATLRTVAVQQTRDEFDERFAAIGGSEGLRRIQSNAVVLMTLAGYIEMWSVNANSEEIAQIRRDGLLLGRTALKLGLVSRFSNRYLLASRYLNQTAQLYCGMVERLLALCEVVHVARYSGLIAAVNW